MRRLLGRKAVIIFAAIISLTAIPAGGIVATATPALASCDIDGPYSVTPSSGLPQAMHFRPTLDCGNWNYRAWVICGSDGGSVIKYGGWHTFASGLTSNTANCGGTTPATAATRAGYDFRQSDPIEADCWIPGEARNGTCFHI